jgi:dUTP pyrophosphatase
MNFYFVKTTSKATLPLRQTPGSAGYDIYALNGGCVPASGQNSHVVDTGICIIMPDNYYARFESRSSLAFKHRVTAFNGIIDSDFLREMKVQLINNGTDPFHYKPGDRIAQLIVHEYQTNPNDSFVNKREGGFGSTNASMNARRQPTVEDLLQPGAVQLTDYEINKIKIDTQFTDNIMKHNKSFMTTNVAYDIHELVNHHKAVCNMNELDKRRLKRKVLSTKAEKINAWFVAKEKSIVNLTDNDYTKFLGTL